MDCGAWSDLARWQHEAAQPDEPRDPPLDGSLYTMYDLETEMMGRLWTAQMERVLNG